jgi:hypothetical protein
MPSINLEIGYWNHPKTKRLRMKLGKPHADALPPRLWDYAGLYHAENGRLVGYTDMELEAIMLWDGEPGAAIKAMLEPTTRFLRKIGNGYEVHEWKQHNGHLVAYKKRAEKAADARWSRIREGSKPGKKGAVKLPDSEPLRDYLDWVLVTYFKLDPKSSDSKVRDAVQVAYAKHSADAFDIVRAVMQDAARARQATLEIGRWLESRKLTWGLGTIAKYAGDWNANSVNFRVEGANR